MTINELQDLKIEYNTIEIPAELGDMVKKTCDLYRKPPLSKRLFRIASKTIGIAASVMLIFGIAVNTSSVFAAAVEDIPILGSIARVINIKTYHASGRTYEIDINIPEISGLANKHLQELINTELSEKGEALYESVKADIAKLCEEIGEDHVNMGISTDFEVTHSDEKIFSMRLRYSHVTGTSYTEFFCYNVDQQTGKLLSIGDLFSKDSCALEIINTYLIDEMRKETTPDGRSIYWINDDDIEEWRFTGIDENHNFYINKAGRLVITFDKYEIAAGAYGTPEFEIPLVLIEPYLGDNSPLS